MRKDIANKKNILYGYCKSKFKEKYPSYHYDFFDKIFQEQQFYKLLIYIDTKSLGTSYQTNKDILSEFAYSLKKGISLDKTKTYEFFGKMDNDMKNFIITEITKKYKELLNL